MRWLPVVAAFALLAGCTLGPTGPFAKLHDEKMAESAVLPGLKVSGILDGEGDRVEMALIAANEGPHTYRIPAGCANPWGETMTGPMGVVMRNGTQGSCHSLSIRDFRPGESVPFVARWRGDVWSDEAQGNVPAAPGTYAWTVWFQAYRPADVLGEPSKLPVTFEVEVR